jgi:hypothetical protein
MRIEAGNASCNWPRMARCIYQGTQTIPLRLTIKAVNRKRGLEENDTLILLKRNRFDIGKKRGG